MRWRENVLWQFFSGQTYCEHRLPCDATQIGRLRRDLGVDGLELLLKATIDTAVAIDAIKPKDLEQVIVDSAVQEIGIAHPVDSRLLEITCHNVVSAVKRADIEFVVHIRDDYLFPTKQAQQPRTRVQAGCVSHVDAWHPLF